MSRRRWYASLGSRGGSHAAIPVRINIPVYLMLMSESCIHLHTSHIAWSTECAVHAVSTSPFVSDEARTHSWAD